MAAPVIHRLSDPEAVSQQAARIFRDLSIRHIESKGIFTVALSGGSTPRRLYELLATTEFREGIRWDRVVLFWGDERCVQPYNQNSNFRMANDALLNKLTIPEENIHRIRVELEPEKAANQYENELRDTLISKDGIPAFDLVMLGVGTDGHTASLFPDSGALHEKKRLAVAVYEKDIPRVTLTLPVINNAGQIMFLATGEEKRKVIEEILSGVGNHPAGMVNVERAVWILDEEAAG